MGDSTIIASWLQTNISAIFENGGVALVDGLSNKISLLLFVEGLFTHVTQVVVGLGKLHMASHRLKFMPSVSPSSIVVYRA